MRLILIITYPFEWCVRVSLSFLASEIIRNCKVEHFFNTKRFISTEYGYFLVFVRIVEYFTFRDLEKIKINIGSYNKSLIKTFKLLIGNNLSIRVRHQLNLRINLTLSTHLSVEYVRNWWYNFKVNLVAKRIGFFCLNSVLNLAIIDSLTHFQLFWLLLFDGFKGQLNEKNPCFISCDVITKKCKDCW